MLSQLSIRSKHALPNMLHVPSQCAKQPPHLIIRSSRAFLATKPTKRTVVRTKTVEANAPATAPVASVATPASPVRTAPGTPVRSLATSTRSASSSSRAGLSQINVVGNDVTVKKGVVLHSKHLAEYLNTFEDPSSHLQALESAADIGAFCLLKSSSSSSADLIASTLKTHLETDVSAAIQKLLDQTNATTHQKLSDVQAFLQNEIDPSRTTSGVGKALADIRDLLDAKRNDSVPAMLQDGVQSVYDLLNEQHPQSIPSIVKASLMNATQADGPMAAAVHQAVDIATAPLRLELEKMSRVIDTTAAAQRVRDSTTLKGLPFEDEIIHMLQDWKKGYGASVEHCGGDNKTGDILLSLGDKKDFHVILEAKNLSTRMGVKKITQIMKEAIGQRNANAGILIAKDTGSLGKSIGDWEEGLVDGKVWVATIPDHLTTAIRYVHTMHKIKQAREHSQDGLDADKIAHFTADVRTAIARTAQIKRHATAIRKQADGIESEATELAKAVNDTLKDIDNELAKHAHVGK